MPRLMRQNLYSELYAVENSHWWHRHKRLAVIRLLDKLNITQGRILDIGCGTGKMLEELKQSGWEAEGIDKSVLAQKECLKRGLKIKLADAAERLPFKNNSFRIVLALDFLEHIQDDQKVVREIKRVLKPNGIILVSVPAYPKLYTYWDKMLGHQRRYSSHGLKQLFSQADLKVIFLSYYFSWLLIPVLAIRLIKKNAQNKNISDFKTNTDNFLIVYIIKLLGQVELWLLKYIKIPFGLSLICLATTQKNSQ